MYDGLKQVFKGQESLTARELADRAGRKLTTGFRHHLERAVLLGELSRFYGWTGKSMGWLYMLPAARQSLHTPLWVPLAEDGRDNEHRQE